MIYSSKATRLFYDISLGGELPADAIEISVELHQELLNGQMANKTINFDTEPPSLMERPPVPTEQLSEIERGWRAAQLSATDGVVARHRDESESGMSTTLTADQYVALQVYRRQLRDWPQAGQFPMAEHRPVAPLWLAEHTH
ncbi:MULTISPECIES: phage tail assembly chaperone [unclassified Pseudomonas]|uniref:phage tail assembly chaperone n=1 Tax=unclassified Pseudomonas TaxID=196821 RepID=UPI0005962748|nr:MULTISPECIES: phage tail assembly chaperone [unclassified Pseudomonas]MBD0683310.1 phage tail protein [Pseudomonas sp. PSB18]